MTFFYMPQCPHAPMSTIPCFIYHIRTFFVLYSLTDCQVLGHQYLYKGHTNITEAGHPCLQWGLPGQRYHDRYTKAVADSCFPEFNMTRSENYCRAPLDEKHRDIWCYIEEYPGWQSCKIPHCTYGMYNDTIDRYRHLAQKEMYPATATNFARRATTSVPFGYSYWWISLLS